MKVLLSWLKEFAPIEGTPETLAAAMTDLGMVVEEIVDFDAKLPGVIVAKVLELRPHPKADRIQLVDVDNGDGEPLQICCGATNMSVGDLVPLATLGTAMPDGMEIAKRKMRGEWSNGMLCAADEIGLGDGDSEGLMILDPALTLGKPIAEALELKPDVLFDLDIETNRPDALSVAGVARDLAARLGVPFALPTPKLNFGELSDQALNSVDTAKVAVPEFCPRFSFRILENISVATSPQWLVSRLERAGMRSINSVVDISNYVMLELGQPNHTYDLDLLGGKEIGVRMAADGEKITTLDGVERELSGIDGVIVNAADEAIGLAGIMGGQSTEISSTTTKVLLEAAVWDRMTIAKTSRRHGLRSEASMRFERGVDPNIAGLALDRFAELAQEICGATITEHHVCVDSGLAKDVEVDLRITKLNSLMNLNLDRAQVAALLEPIGFSTSEKGDYVLVAKVPSWRPDCSIEEDIIEEVARHHGYEKSGTRLPKPDQTGRLTPTQLGRRKVRSTMLGLGFSEAMTLPFISNEDLEKIGLDIPVVSVTNPLAGNDSIMRPTIMPGLLSAISYNQSHRTMSVKFYELGKIFHPTDSDLPKEVEVVAFVMSGFELGDAQADGDKSAVSGTAGNSSSGTDADTEVDNGGRNASAATFAVGSLRAAAASLGLGEPELVNSEAPGLHPGRAANVVLSGEIIGVVGEVDPRVSESFQIQGRVAWCCLEVAPLVQALQQVPQHVDVSLFPSSDVDLAFVVNNEVSTTDLKKTLVEAAGPLLKSIELFDVFRNEKIGSASRSLAYQLRFQAQDHTLTDEEVAAARQGCIDAASSTHSAILR